MIGRAFLDQLASARTETQFKRAAAGLASLQLYESVKATGYDPAAHSTVLDRIRDDLSYITSEKAVHAALDSFTQVLPFWEREGMIGGGVRIGRRAVYTALMIYGKALADDGEWGLSKKVYTVLGTDTELDGETWLSAEARLMIGRASRMAADWDDSRVAYARAYELGMDAGDIALALRARIGEANNLWSRGNFPAAKKLLNATARRARESCPELLPRVILAMAGVANASGEYERAIHLAFGLLDKLADTDEMKYKTFIDLAAFLTDYGLPDIAGVTLRIVERTAPEAQVRVHARLNLFFLAAHHGDEATFGALRSALTDDPLTPRQKTQYALFTAQGLRRFGQPDAARTSAEQAVTLANQFELFQLMFEAEAEMSAIDAASVDQSRASSPLSGRSRKSRTRSAAGADDATDVAEATLNKPARDKISPRMRRVADSLRRMALPFE